MKRIYLSLFLSLLLCKVQAQQWLWAYPVTGNGLQVTQNLFVDEKGYVYFTGFVTDSSTFYDSNDTILNDSLKLFVTKYDSSGNLKWISGGSMSLNAASLDKDGNMYFTGAMVGQNYFGLGNGSIQAGSYQNTVDDFFGKLSAGGNAEYLIAQGASCSDYGYFVAAFDSNRVLRMGVDIYDCSDPYSGLLATYYLKLVDGVTTNTIWNLTPNPEVIYSGNTVITPTTDNGFLLSGKYFGNNLPNFDGLSTSIAIPPASQYDGFLVKYTLAGEVVWAKTVSGPDYDVIRAAGVDGNNNIIFAVQSRDTAYYDGHTLLPLGYWTVHLIKTDYLGHYLQHRSFMEQSFLNFELIDLKIDKHGNSYLTAVIDTTLIIDQDTVYSYVSQLNQINAIIKLDEHFDYVWSQYVDGLCNCGGIITVTDEIVYYSLTHDGPVSLNQSSYVFPAPNNPTHTTFYAALRNGNNITTSVTENSLNGISIFPNPTTGLLNIQCNTPNAELKIYNPFGSLILHQTLNSKLQTLNLSTQPKGIYFIELTADNRREVRNYLKLIVLK
jgi:hypothetical protein